MACVDLGDHGPPDLDQKHVGEFVVVDLISEIQRLRLDETRPRGH